MRAKIGAHALVLAIVLGAMGIGSTSCKLGDVTETFDDEASRDYSGIALPGDPNVVPTAPELHDRATWGSALSADALAYPNSNGDQRGLFDVADTGSPLHFFATDHTDAEGVGPLFNQRTCLGCHNSSEENSNNQKAGVANPTFTTINTVNTPVSRAGRQGFTDYSKIRNDIGNPPTVAFTLYGDFSPSSGQFIPISELGGPLQHDHAVGECKINDPPPFSIDPYLQGGIDPVTNLSPLGLKRGIGERAAPPYVARGLMEAIYWEDLLKNEDLTDTVKAFSSLPPQPDPAICPGDCVSGRHNEGRASDNFVGGDTLIRVGRFGLRGVGVTMLQFDIGGTQGEMGMTSPFAPVEQANIDNPNALCDKVPDPELKTEDILHLRDMIRNISPPKQADALYENPAVSQDAKDVQGGAVLFGVDLEAFRSRMTPGATPVGFNDPDPAKKFDADRGIAADRQLNCVSCHVPITRTGISPAKVGAEHLSNKWAPIFSDLLIHKNPELPAGIRPGAIAGNLSRDLADYAVPPSVTGLAFGNEFRTPPLMGLGRVGPPFFHDARVFVNVIGAGNYPGDPPNPPAATVFTERDGWRSDPRDPHRGARRAWPPSSSTISRLPPDNDYTKCPPASAAADICSRSSQWRSESRNTMEKFRALTSAQQMQVVKFLLSL